MTGHGFRSAASSMLNESGLWNADAIERQLAHVDNDSVRRAYARADFWDERVRMMAWWAERCDEMRRGGVVIPLRSKFARFAVNAQMNLFCLTASESPSRNLATRVVNFSRFVKRRASVNPEI